MREGTRNNPIFLNGLTYKNIFSSQDADIELKSIKPTGAIEGGAGVGIGIDNSAYDATLQVADPVYETVDADVGGDVKLDMVRIHSFFIRNSSTHIALKVS